MKASKRGGAKAGGGNPLTEWGAAAVGLVLLLGSIGVSVSRAVQGSPTPPDIVVTVTAVSPVASGYRVEFTAENKGGSAGAGVVVEGRLTGASPADQVSHVTLDYLPAGSTREAGLFFRSDPRSGTLALRATGYEKP
jgi:uncharacterized protein (TIGR02588 family)